MANKNMTYTEACHAMQSGVAYDQAKGSQDGEPKHLRVGINSAMSDAKALAQLLIRKGIFTEAEYLEEIRLCMIDEVERYEEYISRKYGVDVELG